MSNSRRALLFVVVFAATMILMTGMAFASSGKVNADTVNMRKKPTTDAQVVDQLSKGDKVTINKSSDGWYLVETEDGVDGWVRGDLIDVLKTDAARTKTIGVGTVKDGVVNVREEASTDSQVLSKLSAGSKVTVISRTEDWYKVKLSDGTIGYINASLLSVSSGEQASRGAVQERPATPAAKDDSKPASEEPKEDSGDTRSQIVAYAKKFVGVRYSWGSSSPKGFDCSGLTTYVMKHFGISLDRTSSEQIGNGRRIKKSQLKPGDLVFFDTNGRNNGRISHVGIYIGGGNFIHASSGHGKVMITALSEDYYANAYVGACNVID